MIEYQVEFKNKEGEWIPAGPIYGKYRDALGRLTFEFEQDPELSHRVVQRRQVHTVLATLTTASEVD